MPPPGQGTLTGALACYGFYRTADGRHVGRRRAGAQVLGRAVPPAGARRPAPLHRSGDAATEERVRAELAADLRARGRWRTGAALFPTAQACVTPVLRLDEALAHPHFRARGMRIAADDAARRSSAAR